MKRYRKKAKLAMTAALAISSLSSGMNYVFAQQENKVQENANTEESSIEKEEVVEEKTETVEEGKEELQNQEKATGDVVINADNFPDDLFRKYVSDEFDKNGDDILSSDELNAITRISISANGSEYEEMTSVVGIEHFPNLEELYMNRTQVTNLDVSKNVALTELDLSGISITSIDLSKNVALTELDLSNTQITSIDLSKNLALTNLVLVNNNQITSLDVSKNLELAKLWIHNIPITSIDISKNLALTDLDLTNTPITNLDVSKNLELAKLWIRNAPITSIDISKNLALKDLHIYRLQITSIDVSENLALEKLHLEYLPITVDVSKNLALTELQIIDTPITGLDVSKNLKLEFINILFNYAIVWLHLPDNSIITRYIWNDKVRHNLGEISDTFNIQESFPGIDPNRIMSMEGAEIDKTTGIVSGYQNGTPIVYNYDCGIAEGKQQILEVTLNFTIKSKQPSTISINDNLDKVYDGKPVSDPTNVEITGSQSIPVYEWYTADGIKLAEAPREVGSYKVKAIVAEDDNYAGAEVEKAFTISQTAADQITVEITNDISREYREGQVIENPEVRVTLNGSEFTNGTITFEWYKQGETTPLAGAPMNAGSYEVVAKLEGTANYASAQSAKKAFTIRKAESRITIQDDLSKAYDGQPVAEPTKVNKTGSSGAVSFEWYAEDGTKLAEAPREVGNYKVKAILASDENYAGAEVEKAFTISQTAVDQITVEITNDITREYIEGQVIENPEVQVTLNGSEFTNGTITFEWYKQGETTPLAGAPMNAGSYEVVAKLEGTANYASAQSAKKAFTINKAASTLEVSYPQTSFVYGEEVANPIIDETNRNIADVKFRWYRADAPDIVLAEKPTEVGDYLVEAYVEENENYTAKAINKIAFKIVQGQSTIVIQDDLNKTYDGQPVLEPTSIETTGSSGDVSFEWYTEDGTKLAEVPTNVGSYKVKAILAGDDNYAGAEVEKAFTISQTTVDQITVEITNDITRAYIEGKAIENPEVHVGLNGNEYRHGTITFEWYNQGEATPLASAPMDAGNYEVVAKLEGTTNYASAQSARKAFTIHKATSTLDISYASNSFEYGSEVPNPTVTTNRNEAEVTFRWYRADTPDTALVGKPSEVGDYLVEAYVEENENYLAKTTNKLSFAIRAGLSTIVIQDDLNKAYDGQPVSTPTNVETTGSTGAVSFEWYTADGAKLAEAPREVGNYKVKAILAGDDNYAGAEVEKAFTISQTAADQITVEIINDISREYIEGQVIENPEVQVTLNGSEFTNGTITFEWYKQGETTPLASAPMNAGSYEVIAKLEGTTNYASAQSAKKAFTIRKAESTLEISYAQNSFIYGNEVPNPTVKTNRNEAEVTFRWYRAEAPDTALAEKPSEVGDYLVEAYVEENENYLAQTTDPIAFAITKKHSTIAIHDDLNKAYDGQPVVEPTNVETIGSTGAVSFEWYAEDGTKLAEAPVNAGNYKVKAILAGDANYEGVEVEKDFTISQAKNEWITELSIEKWVYGTTANAPQAEAQFGTVSYTYSTSEDGVYTEEVPSDAGTYWVKAVVEGTDNYEGLEAKVTFQITQAISSIRINSYDGKPYDGTAVSNPTDISKTGSDGAVTFEWFVKDEDGQWVSLGNEAPINAGSYGVKAYLAADANYEAADSGEPTPFEIGKATSSITIYDDLSKAYDGQPVSEPANVEITGSQSKLVYEWYTEDGTKLAEAPMNVGNYKVKAILAGDENYESAETEVEFSISKASNAWTTELSMQGWVYGEEANTPQAEVQFGKITYTYSTSEDGSYTEEVPSDAGIYWVKASVEGTDNYEGLEAKVSFTIEKANSSITIDTDLNKVYDGQPVSEPSITQTGSQSKPVYEWYVKDKGTARTDTWTKLAEAPVEVGSYKLVVSVAEDKNYHGATAEVEFSIKVETVVVPTPPNGGTITNPDGGEIVVKPGDNIESNGPVVENPDGSITFPEGGTVTKPDGSTEVIQPGGVLKPNEPEVVPTPPNGGTITNPDGGEIVVKPGDNIESNGPVVENPDGSITFPEGGTVTKPDGSVEVIQPGGVLNPNNPSDEGIETPGETIDGVQTGDGTQTSMWAMLVGLSMSMMYFFRRKKNR